MALVLDPEVAAAMAPLFAAAAENPPPAGDWKTRRIMFEQLIGALTADWPTRDDVVVVTEHTTGAPDGATVGMRCYEPFGHTGALVVYVHGGGMILGSVELYDTQLRGLAADSGVCLLAVDYRLAPEHPHPTPVEDCYAAVRWAAENAERLGCDPGRLGIAGDSAGGGLAAATTLLARDRGGPVIARQILRYPMLDDRNLVPPAAPPPAMVWTYDDNLTGWRALLGDGAGGTAVPAHAAPARAEDLSGLPPAYLIVGDLDIFRDEDMTYAARLSTAGVPVEFHLIPGAPHAFDVLAPRAEISRRSRENEIRVLRSI